VTQYTIKDRAGNVTGYLSESSGYGCAGCLGLSLVICLIYGAVSLYQFVQKHAADNRIEAQRIVLSADTLDGYAGEYDYGRYKIRIERRADRLFNKSAEEFCELVPISINTFIYAHCVNGFQGNGIFERNGRGGLTLIIIHRDGRTERAAKVN
jgi:hypothetical protein